MKTATDREVEAVEAVETGAPQGQGRTRVRVRAHQWIEVRARRAGRQVRVRALVDSPAKPLVQALAIDLLLLAGEATVSGMDARGHVTITRDLAGMTAVRTEDDVELLWWCGRRAATGNTTRSGCVECGTATATWRELGVTGDVVLDIEGV